MASSTLIHSPRDARTGAYQDAPYKIDTFEPCSDFVAQCEFIRATSPRILQSSIDENDPCQKNGIGGEGDDSNGVGDLEVCEDTTDVLARVMFFGDGGTEGVDDDMFSGEGEGG